MKLYVKYMVSLRCKLLVAEELNRLGLHSVAVELGSIVIKESISQKKEISLKKALQSLG